MFCLEIGRFLSFCLRSCFLFWHIQTKSPEFTEGCVCMRLEEFDREHLGESFGDVGILIMAKQLKFLEPGLSMCPGSNTIIQGSSIGQLC